MLVQKIDYKPIPRKQIEGKRLYETPTGHAVPSVTTILDKTKPEEAREALKAWRKAVGYQRAQAITTEAANRGTRMHKYLEDYVKDGALREPGTNPYAQQSNKMASIVIEKGLCNVNEFWGTEVALYFPQIYAGTTDCVGIHLGDEAILDFKQTNKPKTEERVLDYYMQLAAYAEAHNEVYGTNIKKGVVLMCSQAFEYQEFVLEGRKFEKYRKEWWKRVEEYYTIAMQINTYMKITIVALILLTLGGCALPQKYDNNEFEIWVRMLVSAHELKSDCATATKADIQHRLTSMYTETQVAKYYAAYTPNNPEVSKSADIILNDIVELHNFYRNNDHNVTYCERKADLLARKIDAISQVVPGKKR